MIYRWYFKPADFPERICGGTYTNKEEFEIEFRSKLVGQYEFNGLDMFLGRDMANKILSAVNEYGDRVCAEDPNTRVEYTFEIIP